MKSQFFKTLLCSVVALLAGFTTAYGKSDHHVIDNPWINFSNGSILDITKVEMSDSCTVLTINAYYRPKWWIRIASGSYLQADGEKYTLKGTEGIEPDTEFWLPESGEAGFKLIFEPLPLTTKEFDFIEGNSPLAFRMTGVDLTGNKFNEYSEAFRKS